MEEAVRAGAATLCGAARVTVVRDARCSRAKVLRLVWL
jgi:hypothetical protein